MSELSIEKKEEFIEIFGAREHNLKNVTVEFPGGGLEFGEGTIDCLKREFREEFNLEIEVGELFYLTDFFQVSAFSENDQVISIYYLIRADLNTLDEVIKTHSGDLHAGRRNDHKKSLSRGGHHGPPFWNKLLGQPGFGQHALDLVAEGDAFGGQLQVKCARVRWLHVEVD